MTSLSKKTVPEFPLKKRGRPVGSKNKVVRKVAGKEFVFKNKKPAAAATKPFKRPVNEQQTLLAKLLDDNLQFISDNKKLVDRINNLEHQAIGYRAVVSYLETQLGLKVTQ
jgi:hypothetical protein